MPAKNKRTGESSAGGEGRGGPGARGARGGVTKRADDTRKRTQNRIAQQCLRERRAATSRHMENMLETMHLTTEADESRRYTVLLESHVKLARENQLMEDALFRLRKKLLSLSNAAGTAADDAVFDMMLGRKSHREPSPAASPTASPEAHSMTASHSTIGSRGEAGKSQPEAGDSSEKMEDRPPSFNADFPECSGNAHATSITCSDNSQSQFEANNVLEPATLNSYPPPPIQMPDALDEIVVAPQGHCLDVTPFPQKVRRVGLDDDDDDASNHQQHTFDLRDHGELYVSADDLSFMEIGPHRPDFPACDEPGEAAQLASPWDACSFAAPQKLSIRSAHEHSGKVLCAAFQCIARARQFGAPRHLTTDQITQQVAVAVVNLLATSSGMQEYIYGVVSKSTYPWLVVVVCTLTKTTLKWAQY